MSKKYKSINIKPRENIPDVSSHNSDNNNICDICRSVFSTKSKLKKHVLSRSCSDRSSCKFCGKSFNSFAGVCQHERRMHPLEYSTDLQNVIGKPPDSVILEKLAEIEAAIPRIYIAKMMEATGLTKHQVRYRREKPIYLDYLRILNIGK